MLALALSRRYIEMSNDTWLSSGQLNLTRSVAVPFNASVHEHYPAAQVRVHVQTLPRPCLHPCASLTALPTNTSTQPWAGEIGPHNGGSPPCDPAWRRWANFADSFWYLDALGTKAANGYKAFCRQDYIGGDYGLLDCRTQVPTPDYYTGRGFFLYGF